MNNLAKTNTLKALLAKNNSKFFTVEFIKKNGDLRKINGNIRYVPGHDGINPVAHLKQYITVVLPKKDGENRAQFRNVNLENVVSISVNGNVYKF